ncbi:hypothetical protein ABE65_010410 [Fictibacillus phosphorivorans]|uniref:Uncharacterized protein n=1 Tax=Fictibacillus phosphorivorans TaxID=1221500 RepID=A0A160INQ3_9BACL|nr:hypothetical protein [Fictibacillus phosphorivorans]ANC77192.1 hypothetical protein ABE65_010410 [Fictibacillus phosphorivorans]
MEERQVTIGLSNGQTFSYFIKEDDRSKIGNDILNLNNGEWYTFVDSNWVEYRIKKEEIVSIGVSMTVDEANLHDNELNSSNY